MFITGSMVFNTTAVQYFLLPAQSKYSKNYGPVSCDDLVSQNCSLFAQITKPFQDQQCNSGAPVLYFTGSHTLSLDTLFLLSCQTSSNECPYMLLFPLPPLLLLLLKHEWLKKQFRKFFTKLFLPHTTPPIICIHVEGKHVVRWM